MCAPVSTPTFSLSALTLDELGLLVRHKRANSSVAEAFARALLVWTKRRVQRLCRRHLQVDDVNDLVQEFMVRCLTRHFAGWEPSEVSISAYLYGRLRTEVIDRQRQLLRRSIRDTDVDDTELPSQLPTPDEIQATRETEWRVRRLHRVVSALPRRQRMIMRRSFSGVTLRDLAKAEGVHPSTFSRERALAVASIRREMRAG